MAKIPVRKMAVIKHNKTFIGKDTLKGKTDYLREELAKRQREERKLKK